MAHEQTHKSNYRSGSSHGSVRRYEARAVPKETIEQIVSAGQRAATSSNLQMTAAVFVCDQDRRVRLAELCGD